MGRKCCVKNYYANYDNVSKEMDIFKKQKRKIVAKNGHFQTRQI